MVEFKPKALICSQCGKEIRLGVYPYGREGGIYCYDCDAKLRPQKYVPKQKHTKKSKHSSKTLLVKRMYKKGFKPTEIAELAYMTVEEVYEELNK